MSSWAAPSILLSYLIDVLTYLMLLVGKRGTSVIKLSKSKCTRKGLVLACEVICISIDGLWMKMVSSTKLPQKSHLWRIRSTFRATQRSCWHSQILTLSPRMLSNGSCMSIRAVKRLSIFTSLGLQPSHHSSRLERKILHRHRHAREIFYSFNSSSCRPNKIHRFWKTYLDMLNRKRRSIEIFAVARGFINTVMVHTSSRTLWAVEAMPNSIEIVWAFNTLHMLNWCYEALSHTSTHILTSFTINVRLMCILLLHDLVLTTHARQHLR